MAILCFAVARRRGGAARTLDQGRCGVDGAHSPHRRRALPPAREAEPRAQRAPGRGAEADGTARAGRSSYRPGPTTRSAWRGLTAHLCECVASRPYRYRSRYADRDTTREIRDSATHIRFFSLYSRLDYARLLLAAPRPRCRVSRVASVSAALSGGVAIREYSCMQYLIRFHHTAVGHRHRIPRPMCRVDVRCCTPRPPCCTGSVHYESLHQ